jgi:hypothetical protein
MAGLVTRLAKRTGFTALMCVAAACAGLGLTACGSDGGSQTDAAGPPVLVDEAAGTYRGVAIGDGPDQIQAALGPQEVADENEPGDPLGWEGRNEYGPSPLRLSRYGTPGSESWYRYRDVVLFLRNNKVGAFLVVDDNAQSARGVAVGMPLDRAEAAYPEGRCGTVNEEFPACTAMVSDKTWVWFGGDPIRSITVLNIPPEGL